MTCTFHKQLVDFVAAEVFVQLHLEAQFAESAVELLGVPVGPGPPAQLHPLIKLCHVHHHGPVTLPPAVHPSSPLQHRQRRYEDAAFSCVTVGLLRTHLDYLTGRNAAASHVAA